jgi:hypothetical protein
LEQSEPVKYWEIIADRLHAEGWSYGIAEHFTKQGFLFCVDAHRDGKRFIVKADDLLTAFLSLERDATVPKGANVVLVGPASDPVVGQSSPTASARLQTTSQLLRPCSETVPSTGRVHRVLDVVVNKHPACGNCPWNRQ